MSANSPYLSSSFESRQAPPRRRSSWRLFITLIFGIAVFACALIVFIFSMLRNAEAAKLALAQAESSPAVTQRIGSPLKEGWIVSGNVQVVNSGGHAELSIPVTGPRGSGTLYVEAKKQAGLWKLTLLEFAPKDSTERTRLVSSEASDEHSGAE